MGKHARDSRVAIFHPLVERSGEGGSFDFMRAGSFEIPGEVLQYHVHDPKRIGLDTLALECTSQATHTLRILEIGCYICPGVPGISN